MTLIGSLTANTLPSAVTASGTVGFVLYSSGGALTVPTDATLFPGEVVERVDLVPGQIYPQEMEFSFVEDYTTYAGGFWWKALVLETDAVIAVTLGTERLFTGRVIPETVNFEEVSLQTGSYVRRGTFRAVNMIREFEGVDCDDLMTELTTDPDTEGYITADVSTTSGYPQSTYDAKLLKFTNLFACMLKLAFGQSYDTGHVLYRTTVSDDLRFTFDSVGGIGDQYLNSLYIYVARDEGGGYAWVGFFDSTSDLYWPSNFGNAWELLQSICNNFAVVPRITYDTSDSKFKLEFRTRGTTAESAITFADAPIRSNAYPAVVKLNSIKIASVYEDESGNQGPCWIRRRSGTGYVPATNLLDKGLVFFTEEDLETWDWEFTCMFNLTDNTDGQYVIDYQKPWYAVYVDPDWTGYAAETVEIYDYVTEAWTAEVSYPEFWHVNLAYYYFNRFSGGKLIVEREYPSVLAGVSGTYKTDYLVPLRLTSIDLGDGEGSRTFFIMEVHKDVAQNRSFVRLHEV